MAFHDIIDVFPSWHVRALVDQAQAWATTAATKWLSEDPRHTQFGQLGGEHVQTDQRHIITARYTAVIPPAHLLQSASFIGSAEALPPRESFCSFIAAISEPGKTVQFMKTIMMGYIVLVDVSRLDGSKPGSQGSNHRHIDHEQI